MDNQIQYWDKVSEHKKFTTFLDHKLLDRYLSHNALIVDYGCGYGRTLEELWQKGYRNTRGFDFSKKMIERGKKEFPHLNLKTSKNNLIPHKDNNVDMVILFAVLTCIIQDNEQVDLINEIKRVLKPGGLIYVNDFLLNNNLRNKERYEKYKNKYSNYGVFELPEGAVLRHHNKEWIESLTASFTKQVFKEITFETMNGHQSNGFIYLGTLDR